MMPAVKICGLTTRDAVEAASGADYAGFIFYSKSPRNVTLQDAAKLASYTKLKTVAVTVDADDAFLEGIRSELNPHFFQLHGSETPERVRQVKEEFGLSVIKAIAVTSASDIAEASVFENVADMLLFDARVPGGLPGGNGVAFDWSILAQLHITIPWFLSGGLTTDNVEEALRVSGAKAVDVSSSLESSPGVKNPGKVSEFVKHVKSMTL